MSLHVFHKWPRKWDFIIRRDLQEGEFWSKTCLTCGAVKISETRPRWFV
jgi:hypothetical protein